MPRRSNPFQRLVKIIERQLWPEATLTESAKIGGREIDILIEHQAGGTELRIAVECRDRKRTDSVQWIDSLIGFYSESDPSQEQNPAAHKIIAVSSSGFSDRAHEKARTCDLGIELLTLSEAENVDWGNFELLSEKVPVRRLTLVPSTSIDFNSRPANSYSQMLLNADREPSLDELQLCDEGKTKDFSDFVLQLANDQQSPPYVLRQVMSKLFRKGTDVPEGEGYTHIKVPILSKDVELNDQQGGLYELRSVRYHFKYIVEKQSLSLMEADYRGARIFSDSDKLFDLGFSIALLEQDSVEGIKLSLAVTIGDVEYLLESKELPFKDGKMELTVYAIESARTFPHPGNENFSNLIMNI